MPFHFEQPAWFLLPLFIAVMFYFFKKFHIVSKHQNRLNVISVYLPVLQPVTLSSHHAISAKSSLLWISIIAMCCALAQPVTKSKLPTKPDTLKDIIFLVDTSVGMSIKDYSLKDVEIDRLTLLKAVLSNFVNNLQGNRMGILVYADKAYTMSPLTRDRNLLSRSIERIQPAIAGRQNNLSNALATTLREYDFSGVIPTVVVFSQGANINGDISPLVLANKYRDKNIKLHFIGLGSDQNNSGTNVKLIFDPIDHELLMNMAATTGGEFFWAGKSESLNSILNIIKQSETIEVAGTERYLIKHHYRWPLYALLFLVFAVTLLKYFRAQIR